MRLLIVWLTTAATVLIASYILPWVAVDSFGSALLFAALLGLVNLLIRPLVLLVTLPLNILTLGLFTFVVNALMILLIDNLMTTFDAGNFWTALILSLLIGFFNSLILSEAPKHAMN